MPRSESIVEASIEDLSTALATGSLTSVDLVAKYLLRIAKYDCRKTTINAVPLLNEHAFDEAAEADDRRAKSGSRGPFDGIPYTVKDSYKVRGMTVASGSEAFQGLIANEDAFVVGSLRKAGAVLLGKTNMCPMAYGGMLRGLYGRAESPYNEKYLAAAFGSGSSNGSGAATGASFAAFGMGEETVSSGRSPASNNGLIAYTPSRGYISIRGNWPLYPTCDVIVPHTRTVDDLLQLLDVIAAEDPVTQGDFWRDQPLVQSPRSWPNRPQSFASVTDSKHLKGKIIAVPKMYITPTKDGLYISTSTPSIWSESRKTLEAAGATIKIIDDFPVLDAYENPSSQPSSAPHLPEDWNSTERGRLIAHAWQDFLTSNSSDKINTLTSVDSTKIFPHMDRSDPQLRFTEPANAIKWSTLASYVSDRPKTSSTYPSKSPIYDTPNLKEALEALEAMRKQYFEDWLTSNNYDYVAFPAAGDVAAADADIDVDSAEHAWKNGVKYSHGNRMLRHLGIPSITVSMGLLEDSQMPMGLTILGKAGDDVNLLRAGWCYEQALRASGKGRPVPKRTPALPTDQIPAPIRGERAERPQLEVQECTVTASSGCDDLLEVNIKGEISCTANPEDDPVIEIYIDGEPVGGSSISVAPSSASTTSSTTFDFQCTQQTARPPTQDARNAVVGKIARDSTMVMILARVNRQGRPSGYLRVIHGSDVGKRST